MLPVLLHKRTYLFLTLIVTLPMLLFAYVNASNTRTILMNAEQRQLMAIATNLEQRLPQSFDLLLAAEGMLGASDEAKRQVLHINLQPIINEVSAIYPGYGLGYYSPELHILAIHPLNQELLGKAAHSQSLQIYSEKQALYKELDSGITQNGKPLLALNYPLYYNGSMIGHVWANAKMEDIDHAIAVIIARNFIIVFLFWLGIIGCIYWAFSKIDTSLVEFAKQVRTEATDIEKFQEFPQLIPILETIVSLRENLKEEYNVRKVNAELAKIDRLNLVSQMAAGVAHEIRNPMTVIMGYIQMMSLKADEKTKSQFSIILEELNAINEITTDFLYVARNKIVEKCMCHLNDIVTSHYQLIHANTIKHGIDIELALDSSLPEFECDKKEMSQLILNLTHNAIEAMPGGGKLTIKTQNLKDSIELQVSDTGYGIPACRTEQIFDPFFTTKEQGTGLGLSVCKGIVERHSGEILVQSQEEAGSTFFVRFPKYQLHSKASIWKNASAI